MATYRKEVSFVQSLLFGVIKGAKLKTLLIVALKPAVIMYHC
jgi:hypothetical protein